MMYQCSTLYTYGLRRPLRPEDGFPTMVPPYLTLDVNDSRDRIPGTSFKTGIINIPDPPIA